MLLLMAMIYIEITNNEPHTDTKTAASTPSNNILYITISLVAYV